MSEAKTEEGSEKTAVDDFLDASKRRTAEKRSREHQLWHTWNNEGRTPEHLEPLLKEYQPVVYAKTREWKAPRVNEAAFQAELQTHIIKAFESYDPNRGASLRTHVEHRLPKALRYNAKNQNIAYIPEESASYIGKIKGSIDQLREEFGRDPTNAEIADHINEKYSPKKPLTPARIGTVRSSTKFDFPSSGLTFDPTRTESSKEQEVLSLMQAELPAYFPNPLEREVFEYIYGLNGKPKITKTNELAAKLGKGAPQISRIKKALGNKVKSYL